MKNSWSPEDIWYFVEPVAWGICMTVCLFLIWRRFV